MKQEAITTNSAPKAIGPYSQGIAISIEPGSRLIFVSGQTPVDPTTGKIVPGGISEQTRRCLDSIRAVLSEARSSLDEVLKVTVFLTNMADFQAMNTIYTQYFGEIPPARSTVAVAALPLGALVEIEAIASSSMMD